MMLEKKRKFDSGRPYELQKGELPTRQAMDDAKWFRTPKGYYARVVKVEGGYVLYLRTGK